MIDPWELKLVKQEQIYIQEDLELQQTSISWKSVRYRESPSPPITAG